MRQALLFVNGGAAVALGLLLMTGGAWMDQDIALLLLSVAVVAIFNFVHLLRAAPNPAVNWRVFRLARLWLDKKERELAPPSAGPPR